MPKPRSRFGGGRGGGGRGGYRKRRNEFEKRKKEEAEEAAQQAAQEAAAEEEWEGATEEEQWAAIYLATHPELNTPRRFGGETSQQWLAATDYQTVMAPNGVLLVMAREGPDGQPILYRRGELDPEIRDEWTG